eukprot:m.212914 g.212914  ORF g.212914 m.212914 type:complete len:72 (+) comp39780_c0_seq4:564-779(+)
MHPLCVFSPLSPVYSPSSRHFTDCLICSLICLSCTSHIGLLLACELTQRWPIAVLHGTVYGMSAAACMHQW